MTAKTFLPWWNCAAMILDGDDEIDLDLDVRAATAEEAEEFARYTWDEHGHNPEIVKTRRIDS